MKTPTRILIVEDSPADVELAKRSIRKSVKTAEFHSVENRKDFLIALPTFQPDIVLADFNLSGFDGIKAVRLTHRHAPLTPVIIWTGLLSEDVAVKCMQAGASNFILKDNIQRLAPAIRHALAERQLLLERKLAEEKFQSLFENSVDGIFQSTPGGRYLNVNPAMAGIYGYESPQDMVESVTDIANQIYVDPQQRARFVEIIETRNTVEHYEQCNRCKDGSMIWTSTSARAVRDGCGIILYYEGFVRNITARKLMEERLRASEAKYRTLAEHLPAITYISEPGQFMGVSYISPQIEQLGFDAQTWLADPELWFRQIHPEDQAGVAAALDQFRRNGDKFQADYRLKLPDGEYRWMHDESIWVHGDSGAPILKQGFMLDITDQKQAEDARRETQARYQNLVETAHDLIWSIDLEGRFTFLNRAATGIYGYEPKDLLGHSFLEMLDREHYSTDEIQIIKETLRNAEELVDIENYFRVRNGRQIVLSTRAVPVRDAGGNICGMTGSSHDITARKRTEEKLRQSENRYELVTRATNDVIWEWTPETAQLHWSENAQHVFGYARDEIGPGEKWWDDHIHPDDRSRVVDRLNTLIAGEDSIWREEYRFRLKNGSYAYISDRGYIERDPNGVPVRMIGAMSDITQRKSAEIERQALLEIMQGLAHTHDLQELLKLIHHSIGRVICAENFFVVLHQPETGLFEEIYYVDQYDLPGPPSELEKSITSYVFRSGEPLLLTQARFEELIAQSEVTLMGTNSRSWLGVPLKASNRIIGVMAVQDYETENRYSERDKDFLASIAAQATLAIERKRSETAEREQRALAEALRDTAETLSSTLEYGEVLDHILAAVGRVVPHDAATILLIEAGVAQVVRLQGYEEHGFNDVIRGIKLPLKETVNLSQMLENRQPVVVYDTHTYPGWKRMEGTDWLRSSVGAPISIYGEVIGFVCLDARPPGFFTPVHAERLQAFANQASLAIHNARLLQQAQVEIAERKQAEAELRASEERFRQLADNIQEAFWITDAQTDVEIYMSPAVEKIWGQPIDYLMSEPNAFIKSVYPEDRPAILRALEKEKNGERLETEYRIVQPDGSVRWIWDRAFPIFDDTGRVTRIAGISADITERQKSELALIKSQSRYRELFDSSPISIWEEDFSAVKREIDVLREHGVTDLEAYLSSHPQKLHELASLVQITDANQAALVLYGVEQKEHLLKPLTQILNENTLRHFRQEILGLMSPSKRFVWEGTDITMTGKQMEVFVTGSIPHGYEEDWSKVIVSISEITERKRAEEELRRRAEETAALLETSLALTNLDLKATLQTISTSARDLFAADGCRIFLMEPDGETLHCVVALQEDSVAWSDLRLKLGQGVTGTVAVTGKAEIVNAMQSDPRAVQVAGTTDEQEAIMFAPLKERDRTIGVVSVRRVGAGRGFQPQDLGLLEAFAAMGASAVSNARLFEETQRRLAELEALYENSLAVGRLLDPRRIGERIIETFARYLRWHHVTIRLRREDSDDLELVAFNLPDLKADERSMLEHHFSTLISKVGQGLSGWVIQTGHPVRTGNVHAHPQYFRTQEGIQSGLYMPLNAGERVIGVISVESELPDAFTEQDERLLATLASQAAIAFENARLYGAIHKELSERKRAEDALRFSEAHYRELADSITDILFELDQNMHLSHWNKASEAVSGIPASAAIGRSMREIFGQSQEQARIESVFAEVLKHHHSRTIETSLIINGEVHSFEVNAYPSRRGVSVVAKDVTDRKRTETIMQKRFELMEYAAHHPLPDLIQRTVDEISELTGSSVGFLHFVQEDQSTLGMQVWSTSALQAFNVPISEGTHRPPGEAGLWAEAVRLRRPLIQNDLPMLANEEGLPVGHVPILREMVIPIIRNEKMVAVMGLGNKPQDYTHDDLEIAARLADYAWDITERKQMEEALAQERNQLARRVEERTADLSRANSNLARALRVKDEFLANMSHELRTPLNAILGLSESLGEQIAGPLNEKQQKYITTISESGHHLLALINDILDLAKIEAGQISLDINKVDIRSVCQASLRMVKQLAQKKNQEVTLTIEEGLGLMWADERRLKQMIVNLLGNAVKFTPENGKIGLEVFGDEESNKITLTVWDTGIGIEPNDLERLFQPFVQLDSGLARETTGTGLGLALVAQMARLHGGSVYPFSEPGVGSRFSIVLPWEPALALDSATRLRITGKFSAIRPDEANKPTILLVEDTKEVIMMVRDYLELAGYNIVTAQDGLDALVQANLVHPDLILMDIQMPRMDGIEATRKLRNEPEFKYTPIIALTAMAMPNDRERCLSAGMNEYISKPINLKALVRMIQNCLVSAQEAKPQ